jgi:hypothetical protein
MGGLQVLPNFPIMGNIIFYFLGKSLKTKMIPGGLGSAFGSEKTC